MHPIRVFFFVVIFLCALVDFNECGRGGGGGSRSGGGSSRGGSSGGNRGSGGIGWGGGGSTSHTNWGGTHGSNTGHTTWGGGSHSGSHGSNPSHSTQNKPIGWNVPNAGTGSTNQHTGGGGIGWNAQSHNTAGTGSTNQHVGGGGGGIGWNVGSHNTGSNQRPPSNTNTGSKPPPNNNAGGGNIGWNVQQHNTGSGSTNQNSGGGGGKIGWNVPPHNTGSNQKPSNPNSNTGWNTHNTGSHGTSVKQDSKPLGSSNVQGGNRPVGWDLPPRPSNAYQTSNGHHQNGYQPYQQYPSAQGPTKIKIVNKYNYHYPGYYSPPQPSYYSGYYHTPSYYHYGSSDTGSGALGFALGYGLARLTTPTYSHYSFYDGYSPRYDHYTVHHYYHNRDSIPKTQEIQSNRIIGCVGDTSTVCPVNTTSLCTSEGTLMCVVSAASTVPCKGESQVNCIRSEVPCYNSTAPECAGGKNSTIVNIPCLSNAMVYGPVTYVNNTIIVNVGNGTQNGTAMGNNNSTLSGNTTTTSTTSTTESTVTTITSISDQTRVRRQANNTTSQNFCVTVVALPAKKKLTEGEKTYDEAKNIVTKFFESAWGL